MLFGYQSFRYVNLRNDKYYFAQPAVDQITNPPVEGRGHRVVEERIDSSTRKVEEDSSIATDSTSWPSTDETDIMDNEILETVDYVKSSPEIVTTTATSVEEVIISAMENFVEYVLF